jgi:hypothetical protein
MKRRAWMKKAKLLYGIILLVTLLGLVGCKPEAVTTTIMSTTTAAAPTITATSTVTAAAQTVTITETKTVTTSKTVSPTTTTSTSTTKTTTTTSTPTTTTTIEFTPVTSPDGKLQVITATVVGAGTGYDASRIGLRGLVKNLTANETLKAQVTCEFFSSTGSLGSFTTELPITVGPGAEKNYVIETTLRAVDITSINVSVVVLP